MFERKAPVLQKKGSAATSRPLHPRPERAEEQRTVIGPGVHIKGDLSGRANVDLIGTLEGNCRVEGAVVIRETGKLVGDIMASYVVVGGELQGDIQAAEHVELLSSSTVRGNVQAQRLKIEEGAFVEGRVEMTVSTARQSPERELSPPLLATG
ncbi:MAG: polymer-forming cytoskeletal protein [Acidobacteriota bacterium]